jgi:hypothetical protein
MSFYTHMRKVVIDQNPTERPHPAVANTHTESPTPMRRKGFSLYTETMQDMRTLETTQNLRPRSLPKHKSIHLRF